MSTATRRTFKANYGGTCGTCPAPIQVGDGVFYAAMNKPEKFPVYVKAMAAARAVLREPEDGAS